MPNRNLPKVDIRERAQYTNNPLNLRSYAGGLGSNSEIIVSPSDELLLKKGGVDALRIYRETLHDASVQSSFRKIAQEITARKLRVNPASESTGDKFISEFVEKILDNLPMDDVYTGLLESLITGNAYAEVLWQVRDSGVIPYDIRIRDQRRFLFTKLPPKENEKQYYGLRIRDTKNPWPGTPAPSRKIIVCRYYSVHNSDPYGAGVGRILYPLVKFQRRALESYLLFTDRYATPTAVATAPITASAPEVSTLYNHIANLSQETALVLPNGYSLDFVSPTSSPDVFINLVEHIQKQISILITGEAEVGTVEAGSYASSAVANTVRMTRSQELAQLISHTLNRTLVRWIVDLNFGTDIIAPTISREFDILNSNLSVNDVVLLKKELGYTATKPWLESQFDIEFEEDSGSEEVGKKFTATGDEDLTGIFEDI